MELYRIRKTSNRLSFEVGNGYIMSSSSNRLGSRVMCGFSTEKLG